MTYGERELVLSVHRAAFLKSTEKSLVRNLISAPQDMARWGHGDLEEILGRRVNRGSWKPVEFLRGAEQDMRYLEGPDTGILVLGDRDYPDLLGRIFDPPFVLYRRGELWDQDALKVALVGTRSPCEQAKSAAWTLARDLTELGVMVISGLARGIDALAHFGALEAGATWAVLGSGIDTIYPAGNRQLARKILSRGGGIFSEYGVGVQPRAFRFPARNRIVSGVCEVTVVLQAPRKSGALITAQSALDQGRDVMVHRRGLEGTRGEGGSDWAAAGAAVIETAQEVLQCWKEGP